MAMTIGEANAVQELLDWVLALALFETTSGVTDDALVDHIGFLADRSHKALMAGLDRPRAELAAGLMLGLGTRRIETVDVQGALL